MSSFKDRVSNVFQEKGISKNDVGKAILYFKGMSWITYGIGLTLCYKHKPLRRLAKTERFSSMLTKWDTSSPFYKKTKTFILEKADKLSKTSIFSKFSNYFGLKSKRFTLAIAENTFLYKITLPITLPVQFLILSKLFKKESHNHESRDQSELNSVTNKT